MEKEFIFDVVLESSDICNMKRELKQLEAACAAGRRVVLYGARNAGKTSLVKSLLIPSFRKSHRGAVCLYTDLMGVDSLADIAARLRVALEHGYSQAFPAKSSLKQALDSFKLLRPSLTAAPDGIALSVSTSSGNEPSIAEIFTEISHLSKTIPVLIVLDEFQDVATVSQAEALFRASLQNMPAKIPVLIMGSKKHLLANIFGKPRAPLHNWGEDMEIGPLPYDEYCDYMNERFKRFGISISPIVSRALQDSLNRNPEAINIVCRSLIDLLCGQHSRVEEKHIAPAISRIVEKRARRFDEFMTHLAPSEQKILVLLARTPELKQPTGKAFVAKTTLSTAAVRKAFQYLEAEAVVQKREGTYCIADPLLAAYLRKFR
jgi:hypothetical protein